MNLDGVNRMQTVEVVDYGPHIIHARILLRDIGNHMNEGRREQAEELALQLLVEAKLLLNTIKHQ